MKTETLNLLVAGLFLILASSAQAQSAEDRIFTVSNLIKARVLGDTGDLKKAALGVSAKLGEIVGTSNKCTPRRVQDLSAAYRGLLEAATTADAHQIHEAATHFVNTTLYRSSMYTRCWNFMAKLSKDAEFTLNQAASILAIGREAGW